MQWVLLALALAVQDVLAGELAVLFDFHSLGIL